MPYLAPRGRSVAPRATDQSSPSRTGWIVLSCILLVFLIITPLIWWKRLRSWCRAVSAYIRNRNQPQTETSHLDNDTDEARFQARISQLFGPRRTSVSPIIPDPYTPGQPRQDASGYRSSGWFSREKSSETSMEEQSGVYKRWMDNILRRNSGAADPQEFPKIFTRTRKQAIPTPSAPLPLIPRASPTADSRIHSRDYERVRAQSSGTSSSSSSPSHSPTPSQDTAIGSDITLPSKIHWKAEYTRYSSSEPNLKGSDANEARTAVSSTVFSSVSSKSLPLPPPRPADSAITSKGSKESKVAKESKTIDFGIMISERMKD